MFSQFRMDRLSAGSIYKIAFVGLLCSFMPLCLFFGVLAMFGFNTITWNGQAIHGLNGFLLSPVIALIGIVLMGAFLGTACAVGLWVFSKFRPLLLSGKNVGLPSQDVV